MEIRCETDVRAPAWQAWQLVGEQYGDVGGWALPITSSSLEGDLGVGAVRTCHNRALGPIREGVIRERLLTFDPGAYMLSYEAVDGMPWSVRRAVNRWSVHPAGEARSTVRIHVTMDLHPLVRPAAPLMRRRLYRESVDVLEDLAHILEKGVPSPRKAAALRLAPTVRP